MTAIVLGTVAILALLIMHVLQGRQLERVIDRMEARHECTLLQAQQDREREAQERRQLADRIQAPDRLPVQPVQFQMPVFEPDEIDMVGTIADDPGDVE
jgi:hypothetical protein